MKKYLLCCMLCMAVSASIVGCSSQNNQVETDEEFRIPDEESMGEEADLYEAAEEEQTEEIGELVTSEDEVYQVLVPSAWKLCKNKIDDAMMFEMQGETEEQYIGILVMDELSYGEMDIEEFVDAYAEGGRTEYANAVVSEKVAVDVNGHDAYTLRISGTVDGDNYTNQLYVVKYDNETVVFTASMNTESESVVANVFKDVVFSFENLLTAGVGTTDNEIITNTIQ